MAAVPLKLSFDTRELEAVTAQLAAARGKDMSRYVNRKMGWLLRRALWYTKSASKPRIARDLNLRMRLNKSAVTKNRSGTLKAGAGWRIQHGKTVGVAPRAVLIMAARLRKQGKPSPFLGVSPKRGQRAMKKLISKMSRARARSDAYLKSGLATALQPFLKFAGGQSSGAPPIDRNPALRPVGRDKAFGGPANVDPKFPSALAILRMFQGKFTKEGKLNNAAMRKIVLPALQRAYREEVADTYEQISKVMADTAKRVGIKTR